MTDDYIRAVEFWGSGLIYIDFNGEDCYFETDVDDHPGVYQQLEAMSEGYL